MSVLELIKCIIIYTARFWYNFKNCHGKNC